MDASPKKKNVCTPPASRLECLPMEKPQTEKPLTELQGHIDRITFFNEENGYTIARMAVAGREEPVTVVGNLVAPEAGQFIRAVGEWTRHPKFGEQFRIVHFESILPLTAEGMETYLASGLIHGIGPVMASRIIKRFGIEAIDILEKTPERLLEVEGIGPAKLAEIKRAWLEQREIRTLIVFLQGHGVGSGYAVRIYKHYGQGAVNILKANPYRLAADIPGFGFLTADHIAEKLGFDRDSAFRVEAGILYVLMQLAESGNVYVPWPRLVHSCRDLLKTDEGRIEAAIQAAASSGRIWIDETIPGKGVYPVALYESETDVAWRLAALAASANRSARSEPERALARVQEKLGIRLADKQLDAVKRALTEKVLVITGGPGTGKTTIIRFILELFRKFGAEIALAAPTGRAAKRMTETTGHSAATIHRLLEFNHAKGGFQRNEDHPLRCNLLIIDEVSMIDIVLMKHLLAALPEGIRLILVGDIHQLPSVGPGNVLRDIIASGVVPVVELDEVFRQARESAIIMNAHRILSGALPVSSPAIGEGAGRTAPRDFYIIEREDPQEVLQTCLDLVTRRIPDRFGVRPVEDIQVISPMNKGELGTIHLNQVLQKTLNPTARQEVNRGGRVFRLHDKIMQIRNDYDKDIYNGDIGRITRIDREAQYLVATFDGREIPYPFDDLDDLALAYAVSVHKAQGSEYPVVILPLLTSHYMMLQRNLIYTAITRGRDLVVIVGSRKALAIAVRNEKTQDRFTFLRQRLTLK